VRCPRCGQDDDKVVDSRAVRDGRAVRRRRECAACGERFTTYEALETRPVLVIKRDGRRVAYDRTKLVAGLAKACEKRSISLDQIELVADDIERDLADQGNQEVATETIGTLALEHLRALDDVAYVRFASVYRSFSDLDEFLAVLRNLRAERRGQQ
jgi:transcriptional repressor NrdR